MRFFFFFSSLSTWSPESMASSGQAHGAAKLGKGSVQMSSIVSFCRLSDLIILNLTNRHMCRMRPLPRVPRRGFYYGLNCQADAVASGHGCEAASSGLALPVSILKSWLAPGAFRAAQMGS